MNRGHKIDAGGTGSQPAAATQRQNQGINQHKAIAMAGAPAPERRKK